jgi:hypothetical protein
LRASVSHQALTHEQKELIASASRDVHLHQLLLSTMILQYSCDSSCLWPTDSAESGDNSDDEEDMELVVDDEVLFNESRKIIVVDPENL